MFPLAQVGYLHSCASTLSLAQYLRTHTLAHVLAYIIHAQSKFSLKHLRTCETCVIVQVLVQVRKCLRKCALAQVLKDLCTLAYLCKTCTLAQVFSHLPTCASTCANLYLLICARTCTCSLVHVFAHLRNYVFTQVHVFAQLNTCALGFCTFE